MLADRTITNQQLSTLDRFTCERLSENSENKDLVKDFVCKVDGEIQESLTQYIRKDAWKDDTTGQNAIYLIKTPDGLPCFYFGLKCGTLYKPFDEQELKKQIALLKEKLDKVSNVLSNKDSLEEIRKLETAIEKTELLSKINKLALVKQALQDVIQSSTKDKEIEKDRPMERVQESFPGVELTHFCKNAVYSNLLNNVFPQPIGEVFFWKFVVDKVKDIKKIVGCHYLYLFAADLTEDERLIQYYIEALKFEKENIGVIKPFYDFKCIFLSQLVDRLMIGKKTFFDTFNPPLDAV